MISRALSIPVAVLLLTCSSLARAQDDDDDEDLRDHPDVEHSFVVGLGKVRLKPIILTQVQAIPYVGDAALTQTGDVSERPGFRLRRGRFGLTGSVMRDLKFALDGELASGENANATVHDAWLGLDFEGKVGVYAGFEDVMFLRSAFTSAGEMSLTERPFVTRALAPFHQLGMHVEDHLLNHKVSAYLGVYNAFQKTDHFFQGYLENPAPVGNRFDGLAFTARLEAEPIGRVGPTIEDLYGSKPTFAVGAAGFVSNGGTKTTLGLGADALIHAHGLHVLGEFVFHKNDPKTQPTQPTSDITSVKSLGVTGEVGYLFLKRVIGLTARFELLDPNTEVKDESDSWILTVGPSLHAIGNTVKMNLDYTHREELHGKSLKNDAVVLQFQLNLGSRGAP